ncbi:TPA: hypothetical protein I8273_004430 [Aeromonas hydrophila]|nr:hypothetical protein [Aeromonas hydrophila]HAT2638895.1 hypothetical protein [Aeromonas hydrophila]HAT3423995.1 hypothetical protein [Aeromonas hydrophila]HAT3534031.1 hypothetical protein [Aeromonas hydrophila]
MSNFRFEATTFVQPGDETAPGDWSDGDRQDIASIRRLHPELESWGDLAIGFAFGDYSQDVLEVSWADWIANARDQDFLNYCCWRQTRGQWNGGFDLQELAEAGEWKVIG